MKLTHQQILEKALLKAHRNGWKPLNKDWKNVQIEQWQGNQMVGIALLYSEGTAAVQWVRELEGIIYNKDFAKCLWGERYYKLNDKGVRVPAGDPKDWQHHLQQMVVADDPIAYLGQNI